MAPLTSAQIAHMLETSIPMERVLPRNPLESSGGATQGGGGIGSQLGSVPSAPNANPSLPIGSSGGVASGAPQVTQAHQGIVERVGRRFTNMYSDLTPPTSEIESQSGEISAQNYGINNRDTWYHFNDSLVVPYPIYYAPYRSTGRYVFVAADGLTYHCTASLINQTILVTAGHCVHNGNGSASGWNTSGVFYPAYSNRYSASEQRYGSCQVTSLTTTTGWYNNGALNEGEDVALALCGRLSGAGWGYVNNRFPGQVLGYYGFCYSNCVMGYNFLTQLGYPANYYRGLHMTEGQHMAETAMSGGPDYVFGSGMQGGSSGGPQIQNIGLLWDLASDRGQNTQRNVIYAVTSWGYTNQSIKLQGASPLSGDQNRNNFVVLYNLMCERSRATYGNSTCQLM